MKYFDFSKPDVELKLINILMATFYNPERKRFQESRSGTDVYNLYENGSDRINELTGTLDEDNMQMVLRFNNARIKPRSTDRLDSSFRRDVWLAELPNLRWYGPFKKIDGQ